MKARTTIIAILFTSLLFTSCRNVPSVEPEKSNSMYVSSNYWYQSRNIAEHGIEKKVDVFYLLPTCVGAWKDSTGTKRYNADLDNDKQKQAFDLSCELADSIFGTQCNLFLPYYRQATFGGPEDTQSFDSIHAIAFDDVKASFQYYMRHYNGGRKIVLAGFSQGAHMAVELLKSLDAKTAAQVVATYAIGGGVSLADLKNPNVKLAQGEKDKGVVICFNSMSNPEAKATGIWAKALWENNVACINPITWRCDETAAVLLPAGAKDGVSDQRFPYGTVVIAEDSTRDVTVKINPGNHCLIIDNLKMEEYHFKALEFIFPKGNLHLQDPFFYAKAIKENLKVRCLDEK